MAQKVGGGAYFGPWRLSASWTPKAGLRRPGTPLTLPASQSRLRASSPALGSHGNRVPTETAQTVGAGFLSSGRAGRVDSAGCGCRKEPGAPPPQTSPSSASPPSALLPWLPFGHISGPGDRGALCLAGVPLPLVFPFPSLFAFYLTPSRARRSGFGPAPDVLATCS